MIEPVILKDIQSPIATITFNRPSSMNALSPELAEHTHKALKELSENTSVRVVILKGHGGNFMSGGDIHFFAKELQKPLEERLSTLKSTFDDAHGIIRTIATMPQITIASIEGACVGYGMSLALACDLAVGSASAAFNSAYVHLGVCSDGGMSYHLPRLVGARRALEMMLLAEPVSARRAHELGILNQLVPDAQLEAETWRLAARLSHGAFGAQKRIKKLGRADVDQLFRQLDLEQESFMACTGEEDFTEAVTAFLERRQPNFPIHM